MFDNNITDFFHIATICITFAIKMIWGIQMFAILLHMFLNQNSIISQESPFEYPNWIDDLLEIGYDMKCKMQPNSYDCSVWHNGSSIPRYYYDLQMQTCRTFDYFECKVSLNNFLSLFECNEHCRAPGLKPIEANKTSIYCRLQADFGDCQSYHPMFYYDITSRTCKGFAYSGCGGNRNRFTNVQQCVAVCSGIINLMN